MSWQSNKLRKKIIQRLLEYSNQPIPMATWKCSEQRESWQENLMENCILSSERFLEFWNISRLCSTPSVFLPHILTASHQAKPKPSQNQTNQDLEVVLVERRGGAEHCMGMARLLFYTTHLFIKNGWFQEEKLAATLELWDFIWNFISGWF